MTSIVAATGEVDAQTKDFVEQAMRDEFYAEFAPNGSLLKLDSQKQPETAQSLRMMYYGNVPGGILL